MKRRTFFPVLGAGAAGAGVAAGRTRPEPLAQRYTVVYESPDPARVFAYSPGLALAGGGALVATMDQGFEIDGRKQEMGGGIPQDRSRWWGRIYRSSDRGRTWRHVTEMPMRHARPFVAGRWLYVLGHSGDLVIMRSGDGGASWSEPVLLSEGQQWHQAPCNTIEHRGRIYLVMERVVDAGFRGWPVSVHAPVVMSASVEADLTRRESWVFSNELTFNEAIAQAGPPRLSGVPFYRPGPTAPVGQRTMSAIGWLETNLVRFEEPDHLWHDPAGRTFHLWMRAHTGSTNLAAIAKAVESADRSRIEVTLEQAPSGEPLLYLPCPGGHMKFHILWDARTRLYWLLASQSTDSMTRPERLPANRYGLPNNERHRLALHFSKNCVDWCFAGLVADSGDPNQARHYASMAIDGDDLHVLSRSGDRRARNAHDGNLITFHTVRDFRGLVY